MNLTDSILVREPTASSVLAWPVIGRAREGGIRVGELIRSAGLRPEQLVDGRSRIPLRGLHALWCTASQSLKDPNLGLSILAAFSGPMAISWPEPLSLFEHLFSRSATLREGMERIGRYSRVLRDGLSIYVEDGANTSTLCFELTDNEPLGLAQLHLGMAVLLARRVFPSEPHIREAWFRGPAPDDVRDYEAFFAVPLRFDAPVEGLLCDPQSLVLPLPGTNASMCRTLEWRADVMLSELPDPERVVDRVRQVLRRALPQGDIRAQDVAKQLALSTRTLHRRLQGEGVSYQGVLDGLRSELAKRDLASGRYTPREVGQRVGFTSVSAFYRAFKLWTGNTPAEFRQSASSEVH